jgi:hypothetical protein
MLLLVGVTLLGMTMWEGMVHIQSHHRRLPLSDEERLEPEPSSIEPDDDLAMRSHQRNSKPIKSVSKPKPEPKAAPAPASLWDRAGFQIDWLKAGREVHAAKPNAEPEAAAAPASKSKEGSTSDARSPQLMNDNTHDAGQTPDATSEKALTLKEKLIKRKAERLQRTPGTPEWDEWLDQEWQRRLRENNYKRRDSGETLRVPDSANLDDHDPFVM